MAPKLEWVAAAMFAEGGIYAEVQKLALPRPKYSIVVGSTTAEGTVTKRLRFIPVRVTGQGSVELSGEVSLAVKLMTQAEEWIRTDAQVYEDARIDADLATAETPKSNAKKKYSGPRVNEKH